MFAWLDFDLALEGGELFAWLDFDFADFLVIDDDFEVTVGFAFQGDGEIDFLILEIEVFETGFDAIIDIGDIRNRFLILALGEVWLAMALEWAHESATFWRGKVASDVSWIRTFGSKRSAI